VPGSKYQIVDSYIDKYQTAPKFRIGSAKRQPLSDKEVFEYYSHKDRLPFIDRSNNIYNQTKWSKIKGGAIGHENRVREIIITR